MAYRDDVTATLQQMTKDVRAMREKVEAHIAAPGPNVREHVKDVLEWLNFVRSELQSTEIHLGQVSTKVIGSWRGGGDVPDAGNPVLRAAAGFVPREVHDAEAGARQRAAKATGPAVQKVDEYTTTVKRRECNCGADGKFVESKEDPLRPAPHAKDCPRHPDNLQRTRREVGALPDEVRGQDFNRAAPRPSDKQHLP